MYEIYCKLRDEKGLKDADVVRKTGITKSTFSDWKSGRSKPKNDKLQKIADFFNVSVDYLMTGREKEWEPSLTEKDEQDIQKELDNLLDRLDNNTGLMFDGEAMDDETKELLKASLEHAVRTARITAKKKYTPKKYRK